MYRTSFSNIKNIEQQQRKKQSIGQSDEKQELISLLDKKYPNWNTLLQAEIPVRGDSRTNTIATTTAVKDLNEQVQGKEGSLYKFSKVSRKWKKSGFFNVRLGFDDSQQALQWQDFLEKLQFQTNKTIELSKDLTKKAQKASKTPIKGPQGSRQDFIKQTNQAILEESMSDQELTDLDINIQKEQQQIQAQKEANDLQQQAVKQSQQRVFKIKDNVELSFGNENKLMFNQSNQSLGLENSLSHHHHVFGVGQAPLQLQNSNDSDGAIGATNNIFTQKLFDQGLLQKSPSNEFFTRTESLNSKILGSQRKQAEALTPLSEKDYSEEDEIFTSRFPLQQPKQNQKIEKDIQKLKPHSTKRTVDIEHQDINYGNSAKQEQQKSQRPSHFKKELTKSQTSRKEIQQTAQEVKLEHNIFGFEQIKKSTDEQPLPTFKRLDQRDNQIKKQSKINKEKQKETSHHHDHDHLHNHHHHDHHQQHQHHHEQQDQVSSKLDQILHSKPPQKKQLAQNNSAQILPRPYSKLVHEVDKQNEIIEQQVNTKQAFEKAPSQLKSIVNHIQNKRIKDLLRVKDDSDSLIYNKNNLRVYTSDDRQSLEALQCLNDYNLKIFNDQANTVILKIFYHLDSPLRTLKQLYEEPERMKLWDTNVQSTQILTYMPSHNSKIFHKVIKPNDDCKVMTSQLLIQYSSDIENDTYFMIEQSIEDHACLKEDKKTIRTHIPLNLVMIKQKMHCKTEIIQYLCFNQKDATSRGILSWLTSSKSKDYSYLVKSLKNMYQGLQNYAIVLLNQEEVQRAKESERERKRSVSVDKRNEEYGENKVALVSIKKNDIPQAKNIYQESQNFLNKILMTDNNQMHDGLQVASQDVIPKDKKKVHIRGKTQRITQTVEVVMRQNNTDNEEEKIGRFQEMKQMQQHYISGKERDWSQENQRSEIINSRITEQNIQKRGFTTKSRDIRLEAREVQKALTPLASFGSFLYSKSPRNFTNLALEEEKGMDHYKRSGITQRSFNADKYQRDPSPVIQRKIDQMKRYKKLKEQQLLKQQTQKAQSKAKQNVFGQMMVQDNNKNADNLSIEDLLEESFKDFSNKMTSENNQQFYEAHSHQSIGSNKNAKRRASYSSFSQQQSDNNVSSQSSTSSEDSNYDYNEELNKVYLKQGQRNTFFDEAEFKKDERLCLIYTNQDLLKKQRGVLGHMMKQMGMNLVTGKSIINVSLPLKIFEKCSFLEKTANFMKLAPIFFEKAADIPQNNEIQVLQRFKLVVAFALSMRHQAVQMKKPFNPILGETFQGRLGKYKVGLEQISHHPPISSYQMWSDQNDNFKAYGHLEYRADTSANTVIGHGKGPFIVEFSKGHKIEIWSPKTEINGLMYGERTFKLIDSMIIKDSRNSLYAEIVFDIDKKFGISSFFSKSNPTELNKGDYFEGCISKNEYINYKKNKNRLVQGVDYICSLNGHWTEDLFIDGVQFWHIDEYQGFEIRPIRDPLPSDTRFREDLVYFKNGDEKIAQEWKEALENTQRNDKKLREAFLKKQKKNKK